MESQPEIINPIQSFREVFKDPEVQDSEAIKENHLSEFALSDRWTRGLKPLLEERIEEWTRKGFTENMSDTIEGLAINVMAGQAVVKELKNIIGVIESATDLLERKRE